MGARGTFNAADQTTEWFKPSRNGNLCVILRNPAGGYNGDTDLEFKCADQADAAAALVATWDEGDVDVHFILDTPQTPAMDTFRYRLKQRTRAAGSIGYIIDC